MRKYTSSWKVLGDFKSRREKGRSRPEYLAVLAKDLCAYYGYNEYLMGKAMELFPKGNEVSQLESSQQNKNSRDLLFIAGVVILLDSLNELLLSLFYRLNILFKTHFISNFD